MDPKSFSERTARTLRSSARPVIFTAAVLVFAANFAACWKPPSKPPPADVPVVLLPPWAVKVRPMPGAITRAEYEENTLGEPHKVDAAAFAGNLSKALNAVDRFVTTDREFDEHITDWDVRESDVVGLMLLTIERMDSVTEVKPEFLLSEDITGYPRFHAVWKSNGRYRSVRLNDNNDNDSLRWFVGSGQFAPAPNDTVKATLSREQFLKRIDETFEKSKTIYPHIEQYSVCLPDCD